MFSSIGSILKVILFFLGLWGERNGKRAKVKKEIAKEIVDAIATTNKKTQAARLNACVGRINRM